MHFIQKHILKALAQHPSRRYSELQPPHVESNKFSYHLQKLISQGYIRRARAGYALTSRGVHYSARVNFEAFAVRIQPKIVTLVACKDAHGAFLMYRRAKQPFLGTIGFPYGKIHLGESAAGAAARELREKTGISATLAQKGIIYLHVTDAADETIEHMLCHIFIGRDPRGELAHDLNGGAVSWMSEREIENASCMPGVLDVLRIAASRKQGLQFEELSFTYAA